MNATEKGLGKGERKEKGTRDEQLVICEVRGCLWMKLSSRRVMRNMLLALLVARGQWVILALQAFLVEVGVRSYGTPMQLIGAPPLRSYNHTQDLLIDVSESEPSLIFGPINLLMLGVER
jgi:hypothetical protein